MNPFDKLFDYNGYGELDCFERAVQYQFLDESDKKNDLKKENEKILSILIEYCRNYNNQKGFNLDI